jgi:hypothetical protein
MSALSSQVSKVAAAPDADDFEQLCAPLKSQSLVIYVFCFLFFDSQNRILL